MNMTVTNPDLPTTIGNFEFDAEESSNDLPYCEESYFYSDGDERGISITNAEYTDGYELRSRRWGDSAHDSILVSVPIGEYDTIAEAVGAAQRTFDSIRGIVDRLKVEVKHRPR